MSGDIRGDSDFVRVRDIPPSTLFLLSVVLPAATAAFLAVFHLLAALVGWPGPYLWFGSGNRLADISEAVISTFLAGTMLMAMGVVVLKFLARQFEIFNFKVRVRRQ